MSNMTPIDHLFTTYCALTGYKSHIRIWEYRLADFIRAGFTENDLIGVIKWIHQVNRQSNFKYSTNLGKLLDLEHFSDLRHSAQAHYRSHPKTSARAKILADWRGFEPTDTTAIKTVGQVLARMGDKV